MDERPTVTMSNRFDLFNACVEEYLDTSCIDRIEELDNDGKHVLFKHVFCEIIKKSKVTLDDIVKMLEVIHPEDIR